MLLAGECQQPEPYGNNFPSGVRKDAGAWPGYFKDGRLLGSDSHSESSHDAPYVPCWPLEQGYRAGLRNDTFPDSSNCTRPGNFCCANVSVLSSLYLRAADVFASPQ